MTFINTILENLPEVRGPEQKHRPFNEKIKWLLIMLLAYFILGVIPIYGLGENALQQFDFLAILLGAQFGSLISLGIGPMVTSSIVLQLLNGAGILKFDTTSHEGRVFFQGVQKALGLFFIVFEACIYVLLGGLAPDAGLAAGQYQFYQIALIGQLILGGILVMFMDEVVSKYGFG